MQIYFTLINQNYTKNMKKIALSHNAAISGKCHAVAEKEIIKNTESINPACFF